MESDKVVREAPDLRINNIRCNSHHETWFVQRPGSTTHESNQFLGITVLTLLVAALIVLHVLVAPYTKVEESFHVQAIHDILAFGLPGSQDLEYADYDHFAFPGAVPRTAVGDVVLAKLSQAFIALNSNINQQILGTFTPLNEYLP